MLEKNQKKMVRKRVTLKLSRSILVKMQMSKLKQLIL